MAPAQGIIFPFPLPPGGTGELALSISDTTTDLGVPFQMVISADPATAAMQASFTLSVDPAQVLITGWSPGPALQAYLNANGPIGCDDSNTGSVLTAFFFLNVPFDPAVHGTDFVIVDCLAIAQQTGTTTATLTSTLGGATSTAVINFPGGTPIDPSQIPQPPQPPLPPGMGDYAMADASAIIGQPLSLPVDVTSTGPIGFTSLMIQTDVTQLSIVSVDPGPGLAQYIADNGPIPCDVMVTGDSAMVFMLFLVPFDTTIYGTDFVNVNCNVTATAPGTTQVLLINDMGATSGSATITIATASDAFVRGDSNVDGACNIADAVNTLNYLFNGGSVACMDAADMNDDGTVNLADPLALLNGMFGSTTPFVESCELDLSTDSLDCAITGC